MAGRPAYKPTEEARKQVETLAGFGVPQADIARTVGINQDTLRKYYRAELDNGETKANAAVAQSLYKKALGDKASSVTAAIFWLKTRAGWKETAVHELTGPNGGPLQSEVKTVEQFTEIAKQIADDI